MGRYDSHPSEGSTLRDRLEWARASKGLKKGQLADAVGISASRVSEWTRADAPVTPNAESMGSLSAALDVDVGWLATGYGSPDPAAADESVASRLVGTVERQAEELARLQERQFRLERLALRLVRAVHEAELLPDDVNRELFAFATDMGGPDAVDPAAGAVPEPVNELERELAREARRAAGRDVVDAPATRGRPRRAPGS